MKITVYPYSCIASYPYVDVISLQINRVAKQIESALKPGFGKPSKKITMLSGDCCSFSFFSRFFIFTRQLKKIDIVKRRFNLIRLWLTTAVGKRNSRGERKYFYREIDKTYDARCDIDNSIYRDSMTRISFHISQRACANAHCAWSIESILRVGNHIAYPKSPLEWRNAAQFRIRRGSISPMVIVDRRIASLAPLSTLRSRAVTQRLIESRRRRKCGIVARVSLSRDQ